ncbi:MAG: alpha/beta hydrolase [Flavobacteriales bacterium]
MKNIASKTVVFITGAFVSNKGWDNWKAYFEQNGYKTLAPAWPLKEGEPAELRQRHLEGKDGKLAALGLTEVVDHYARIIENLPEKPILIGHSMGGLITQLLVQRGLAEAAVLIHSVAPQGVLTTKFSFFKATWGPLGFFSSAKKTFLMSFKQWQYAFTNGMDLETQKKTYEENVIPESRTTMRQGLGKAARVDFKKPHAPLLFVAGSIDHIMPAALNLTNYKKYKKGNPGSVTDYKEFPSNNHFVLGLPDWQDTAQYIRSWIEGK